jgi:hypothetical protein
VPSAGEPRRPALVDHRADAGGQPDDDDEAAEDGQHDGHDDCSMAWMISACAPANRHSHARRDAPGSLRRCRPTGRPAILTTTDRDPTMHHDRRAEDA